MWRQVWKYVAVTGAVITTVVCLRTFCIGSYRLATDAMHTVLGVGDCVLADKLHRHSNPGRGRVVVFGIPPRDGNSREALSVGRCVAMPGDTVCISADGYSVGGRLIRTASEKSFRINKNIKPALLATMQQLDIPLRNVAEDSLSITIRLTRREESLLRDNLHRVAPLEEAIDGQPPSYAFVVPGAGYEYETDSLSLLIYADAIARETSGALHADGCRLVAADGTTTGSYRFVHDYYWLLSDSDDDADSRHLGLIDRRSIVGNVLLCWYSANRSRIFKTIR